MGHPDIGQGVGSHHGLELSFTLGARGDEIDLNAGLSREVIDDLLEHFQLRIGVAGCENGDRTADSGFLRCFFGGSGLFGSRLLSRFRRGGLLGICGRLCLSCTGNHRQHHQCREDQCKNLLHFWFSSLSFYTNNVLFFAVCYYKVPYFSHSDNAEICCKHGQFCWTFFAASATLYKNKFQNRMQQGADADGAEQF